MTGLGGLAFRRGKPVEVTGESIDDEIFWFVIFTVILFWNKLNDLHPQRGQP